MPQIQSRVNGLIINIPPLAKGLLGRFAIVVDLRQHGIFIGKEFCFGAQIFRRYQHPAVITFPLQHARIGAAIAFQFGSPHAGPFGNDDRPGRGEVG